MEISGNDLIEMGFKPGKGFNLMLADAKYWAMFAGDKESIKRSLLAKYPPEPEIKTLPLHRAGTIPFYENIIPSGAHEEANYKSVIDTMTEVMRTPVVKSGAIMPDACPAGPPGTIPVGGVVASEHIHPGMHSADICCSLMATLYDNLSPKEVLDKVEARTHFGPVKRSHPARYDLPQELEDRIMYNDYLKDHLPYAKNGLGTQGDGNHFAFVGTSKLSDLTTLVTHHGSRAFGARLYKEGMKVAEKHRRKYSPDTLKQNAWIPHDSPEGREYWEALQIVRDWTKLNHQIIHDIGDEQVNQFWNEHNFVFKKDDGLFYHAKGATPAYNDWADDASLWTIIPLNMSEPVLIVLGKDSPKGLGFSPHGAGRNYSRTQHNKMNAHREDEDIFLDETKGLDIRSWSGKPDISELPSAYKNAKSVKSQIEVFELAEIVDEIIPYGSIMAGELPQPWREKKKDK